MKQALGFLLLVATVVLLGLLVAGCGQDLPSPQPTYRFVVRFREHSVTVYEDTKTGHCFVFLKVGYGAGLAHVPAEVCNR